MDDEEQKERPRIIDPLGILPFECWLEPEDENVVKLPKTFGSMQQPVGDGENYI